MVAMVEYPLHGLLTVSGTDEPDPIADVELIRFRVLVDTINTPPEVGLESMSIRILHEMALQVTELLERVRDRNESADLSNDVLVELIPTEQAERNSSGGGDIGYVQAVLVIIVHDATERPGNGTPLELGVAHVIPTDQVLITRAKELSSRIGVLEAPPPSGSARIYPS